MTTLKNLAKKITALIIAKGDISAVCKEYVEIRMLDLFNSHKYETDTNYFLNRSDVAIQLINCGVSEQQIDLNQKNVCYLCHTWEFRRFSSAEITDNRGTILREAKSNVCIDITHNNPTDIACFIVEADMKLSQWFGVEWNMFVESCYEQAGLHQDKIAQLESEISKTIFDTDIKYCLSIDKQKANLSFLLKENQQITFDMSVNSLIDNIQQILSDVMRLNDTLDSIKCAFKIDKANKWTKWK